MRNFTCIFLIFALSFLKAQNNIRIFSGKGELFTITAFDSIQNRTLQANVLLSNIYEDTLRLKIETENKLKLETTLFLFEKGKITKGKEFNYRVDVEQNKLKVNYSGSFDIVKLPEPLIPNKPVIDTVSKYKNTRLGHFCELKDGKPLYFNNIPKDGNCITPMPEDYLSFINFLMQKTQIDDEKFLIADNVFRNNCVSVAQLNFVLKYIEYELEKLKLIKIAYFNITDKTQQKELEKSFSFESSINELREFLKIAPAQKIKSGSFCKTPSSAEEMNVFQNNMSVYTNDSQRFEAFKKSYENYCFSKDQVIIVLSKFIHDREKFDAAKMIYFRCTQKEMFLEISDVFSYNETINELKDFIAKQKD